MPQNLPSLPSFDMKASHLRANQKRTINLFKKGKSVEKYEQLEESLLLSKAVAGDDVADVKSIRVSAYCVAANVKLKTFFIKLKQLTFMLSH